MIYLDNAATTPMSAAALAEMTKVMQETHGNPSSIHSHGLFVEGAADLLDATNIKEILVTDSVATKERTPKNVCYITASELIGDAIVRIHERKPVSPLFAYNKKE